MTERKQPRKFAGNHAFANGVLRAIVETAKHYDSIDSPKSIPTAVAHESAAPDLHIPLRRHLAPLVLSEENFPSNVRTLRKWLRTSKPDAIIPLNNLSDLKRRPALTAQQRDNPTALSSSNFD